MNIKKTVKWILRAGVKSMLLICLICLLNFCVVQSDFLLKRSIESQIHYLEVECKEGLSEKAQRRFPEGRLFTNLILALSIIEYSEKSDYNNHAFVESLILDCTSPVAKRPFVMNRTIQYGAFYNGWISYTLKKYIASKLFKQSNRSDEIQAIRATFDARILESQRDSIKVLGTYDHSIWPGDNLACIASLDSVHQALKSQWVDLFYTYSKSGLIAHEGFGEDAQLIRGSSQALIHYFLYEIDSSRFKRSIKEYRRQFVDDFVGIEFVKEFSSSNGSADADSGPIIIGYGSVATIMNNKLSLRYQKHPSRMTLGLLNMLGMPFHIFGKKYFLGGFESMYDVFYLWNAVEAYKK